MMFTWVCGVKRCTCGYSTLGPAYSGESCTVKAAVTWLRAWAGAVASAAPSPSSMPVASRERRGMETFWNMCAPGRKGRSGKHGPTEEKTG